MDPVKIYFQRFPNYPAPGYTYSLPCSTLISSSHSCLHSPVISDHLLVSRRLRGDEPIHAHRVQIGGEVPLDARPYDGKPSQLTQRFEVAMATDHTRVLLVQQVPGGGQGEVEGRATRAGVERARLAPLVEPPTGLRPGRKS